MLGPARTSACKSSAHNTKPGLCAVARLPAVLCVGAEGLLSNRKAQLFGGTDSEFVLRFGRERLDLCVKLRNGFGRQAEEPRDASHFGDGLSIVINDVHMCLFCLFTAWNENSHPGLLYEAVKGDLKCAQKDRPGASKRQTSHSSEGLLCEVRLLVYLHDA